MIDQKIYDLDYIRGLQTRYKTDPGLLERVLYAFGLLEALAEIAVCRNDVTPPLGIQPHVEGLANLRRITPTCIEVAFG